MDTFADAMGDRFCEGMRLLDYGCGSGRFGAYMAARLKDFRYWGFDLPEPVSRWRKEQAALDLDSRYEGFYPLHQIEKTTAIADATDVLLLSILTHLSHGALFSILARVLPILSRGGYMHASLFLGDRPALYAAKNYGEDGLPVYWRRVVYTEDAFEEACTSLGLVWKRTGKWIKKWEQVIVSIRRGP